MDAPRDRNVIGAFALMLADDVEAVTSASAPDAGPGAAALALLDHEPGMSIRTLSHGVGLSHAATVRLVDRLVAEGLVERQGHATDKRARSLFLTVAGEARSRDVFAARDNAISTALDALTPEEQVLLSQMAERVLRSRLRTVEHAYRVCRLCAHGVCAGCPVDEELMARGIY